MKKIDIQGKHSVQNPIEFVLGNGERIRFTSKRTAAAFIADTNRYLTKCLVILNNTYCDLFYQYRNFWLTASNTNTGTKTNYHGLSASIRKDLDGADFIFEKFNTTRHGSNDPFFSFIDLKKIALFLGSAADGLAEIHKKRNATADHYNCMILSDRCLLVIERLHNYHYSA